MTIDKINITDFGKLSDVCIETADGMNVIYAPNESGKSTLLAFVKFIFYGTRHKKAKGDLSFKEKYMPWSGMPMSGSIEFSHMGKKYIIYRCEGAKNGSKKLEVSNLITGEPCREITDPGRYFFSVGEKAFSDSCFVTDIFPPDEPDGDLISMISQGSTQSASYARVRSALEEHILSLTSPKRATARLTVIDKEIADTRQKLITAQNELSDVTKSISDTEKSKTALKSQLSLLNAQIREKDRQSAVLHLARLRQKEKAERANLEQLMAQIDYFGERVKKSSKPFVFGFIIFALIAAVLFLCKISAAGGLSVVVAAFFAFAAVRKKDVGSSDDADMKAALEKQIAVSHERLSDLESEISRYIESNPDISFDNEDDINQTNCFTNEEINGIMTRIEQSSVELNSLSLQHERANRRSLELGAHIDQLGQTLCNLDALASAARARAEVYRTALLILDNAFAKMRDNFAPELSQKAFDIFSDVTKNDCSALVTNEKFESAVKINNEYKDVRALSSGTKDLARLALRIAVSAYLSDGTGVPMFFDDVLSSFDDDRCRSMLKNMYSLSRGRQIFLCTCRKREVQLLSDCRDVTVITLRKDDNNG